MQGIIVAADSNQEWLLNWWWEHYSAHNSFPVVFVDFGMSEEGIEWCRKRGKCVPLQGFDRFVEKRVSRTKRELWEKEISSLFKVRKTYFKKPFAMLQSPFEFSLWLDLDCQVLGRLDPLFYSLHLVEMCAKKNANGSYSAAVVAFRKGAAILQEWVEEILKNNDQYLTDEQVLSQLWRGQMDLSSIYNWNPLYGPNSDAVILHYQGGFLKEELRRKLLQ